MTSLPFGWINLDSLQNGSTPIAAIQGNGKEQHGAVNEISPIMGCWGFRKS